MCMTYVKHGLFGNLIFEYCLARIIAENNNLMLKDSLPFFDYANGVDGRNLEITMKVPRLRHALDFKKYEYGVNCGLEISGWFQRYEYYKNYKDKIKSWLRIDENGSKFKECIPNKIEFETPTSDDLVIHIRSNDYKVNNLVLKEPFIVNSLKNIEFNKLFIATDEPDCEVVTNIKKYFNGTILPGRSNFEDFYLITKFKKIFMSQSTFSWWAAYLSTAESIYVPLSQHGPWGPVDDPHAPILTFNKSCVIEVDLRVDESRYIYI